MQYTTNKLLSTKLEDNKKGVFKKMKTHQYGLAMFVGLTLSFSTPVVKAENSVQITSEQQQSMGLKKAQVGQVEHYPLTTVTAKTIFALDQQAYLSAPLDGKVVKLHKVHGKVNSGEVVIELQSPQYLSLQSEMLSAQMEYLAALKNLQRAKSLNESGITSDKQLNQARIDFEKTKTQKVAIMTTLKTAGMSDSDLETLLNKQKVITGNLKLSVNNDGQLYELMVKKGSYVSKGQALISLGEDKILVLDAPVPIELAKQLNEGDKVNLPEFNLPAEISHIDQVANSLTQTVDVHVRINQQDFNVYSGQLTTVEFLRKAEGHAYQAPASALSKLDGQQVVYLPQGNNVKAIPVEVLSVADGQLYFKVVTSESISLDQIFVSGTAAIKAAFNAGEEE